MVHVRLHSVPEKSNAHFDFVVVGGGSAGCVVAARLADADPTITVALIEAGGHATEIEARMPVACGKMQKCDRDWQYRTEPARDLDVVGLEGGGMKKAAAAFRGLVDGRSNWPRGKCLGGCSITNYMAYVRGDRRDFDVAWAPPDGGDDNDSDGGWGWKGVLPLFIKSEDNENLRLGNVKGIAELVLDDEVHGVGGPLGVSSNPTPGGIPEAFVKGAVEMGFTSGDYNDGDMEKKVGIFQQTIRRGRRADTATEFIFNGSKRGGRENLFVITHGQATRLLFSSESSGAAVVGVEVADISGDGDPHPQKRYDIFADREVIVSCGAVGSPHLLLLSGIGCREDLERAGVPPRVDSPDVGKNMEDHPVSIIMFKSAGDRDIGATNGHRAEGLPRSIPSLLRWLLFGKGLHATSAYDATLFYKTEDYRRSHPRHGPDAQIGIFCSTGDDTTIETNIGVSPERNFAKRHYENTTDPQGVLMVPTLLHPRSVGRIELASADPFVHPKIHSGYLEDDSDVARTIDMYRTCFRLARTEAMSSIVGDPVLPPDLLEKHGYDGGDDSSIVKAAEELSDDFFEEFARTYVSTLYHPACTCKMGRVVDRRLKVVGVPSGLRIADASVFPAVTSGNTNAPCIMVGEKAAVLIIEDHGLGNGGEKKTSLTKTGAPLSSLPSSRSDDGWRKMLVGAAAVSAIAVAVGLYLGPSAGGKRNK